MFRKPRTYLLAGMLVAVILLVTLTSHQLNASAAGTEQVKSPKIPKGLHYAKIPGQVLFAKDKNGNPIISGDLGNIKQGDAGDCYFLSSLLAVAQRSPDTIKQHVHDNGDGTYSGMFYGLLDGTHRNFQATVNGELPEDSKGNIAYNDVENIHGQTVTWAAMTEKLWAAVNKNDYAGIDGIGNSDANDHDIQNGLYALTGKDAVGRKIASLTIDQIQHDHDQGVIVIGTAAKDGKLEADHAFAVLGVDAKTQVVTLGNPDGDTSKISLSDLKNSNANQYFTVQIS
ncbi:hypothetical protein EPA93_13780 [Ktedonosporobacter rubrisoli]|uniref:Calpain catalytic domain-containing protein n=1 Tax=Ktedonosporobacter rubrisoli TaxID=2509675 RepID=A0A4P6JQH7_KTERU|nr:C2 family cysteine protease [Ktedonosporobacter rubrisoli]QBD77016.1 hypothetical protein EPA93_13780 [Ktedonosporobacter rubrisoli]